MHGKFTSGCIFRTFCISLFVIHNAVGSEFSHIAFPSNDDDLECNVERKLRQFEEDWKVERKQIDQKLDQLVKLDSNEGTRKQFSTVVDKIDFMTERLIEATNASMALYGKMAESLHAQPRAEERNAHIVAQPIESDAEELPPSYFPSPKRFDPVFTVDKFTEYAANCLEILKSPGQHRSGLYILKVADYYFQVWCDMVTDGGGWIVFQRRTSEVRRENFFRFWKDYQNGFGNLEGEFWLGLDKIHLLTYGEPMSLRVDLEDFKGNKAYAFYSHFDVGDENEKYMLLVDGYSGNAGDSLLFQHEMAFSTRDYDNDLSQRNCAVDSRGAWWYKSCHQSNLNGRPSTSGAEVGPQVISWQLWKNTQEALKITEMKMRPTFDYKSDIVFPNFRNTVDE